jgi:hypothetical protein
MAFVTFDIEITQPIPAGVEDWRSQGPLGISCAATLTSDGELRLWHGQAAEGEPYPPSMRPAECQELLAYLETFPGDVVTWNGLGFDFQVLAEESGEWDRCRSLAARHVDPAFAMLCARGFMVGLAAAADGMRVPGKLKEVGSGAQAPELWAAGRESQELVLRYVAQDVRTTREVYQGMTAWKCLRWITKRGRPANWMPLPESLVVRDVLALSDPDVSWLSDPWPRSRFAGWLTPGE